MSKLHGKWINKDTDHLTHDGDNLKIDFKDSDAADSNKVWSSAKVNTVSGVLQDDIDTRAISGGAEHDGFSDFVANEHVDHSSVDITAGTGLTGGGDITVTRTLDVDVGITDDKIVQIDDTDAESGDYAKLTASGIEGRSAAEVLGDLSGNADADFSMNTHKITGVVDPTEDQHAATKKYVDDEVVAVGGGIDEVEYITIDSNDISNKYTVLSHTPYAVTEVALDIIGGCAQIYDTDYTVSGTQMSWDGLNLDGIIEANDKVRAFYTYTT